MIDERELLEYLGIMNAEMGPEDADEYGAGWSCAVRRMITWVREHQEGIE